ncbi:MAG: hypothetical protein FJY92_09445, partial [Candidatus Hydrogenedentes bacterium]|nr:hypothetical protein [Candidatus Hydrogenedentota bacterium]
MTRTAPSSRSGAWATPRRRIREWSLNSSRGEAARAVAALFTVVAPAALAGLGADAGSIAPSSSPLHLTVCGDFVYFSADDGTHGRELWAADLSAICRMVADIQPGPVGSGPEFFSPLGDRALMFCAKTEASGKEPWVVDDMAGTVRMLADLFPGTKGSDPVPTAFVANRYFLTARLSSHTIGRFLLLGTIPGGAPTALIGPLFPGMYDGAQLTPSGVVCAGGDRIWYSDGTENGTRLLFRFESGASRVVDNIVSLGPRIVFRAYDRDHGMELWGTDGTPAGTGLIKDIAPGPDESVAGQFERVGGVAYFQADDASRGLELWVTDGTPDGTRMVKDINPGGPSSDPHYFTAFGDWVYFCADDGRHGIELWRTDGTDEGTVLAADVYPGQASG